MLQGKSHGADQPVIPAEFPLAVAAHPLNGVAQQGVRHPLQQIVGVAAVTVFGEQWVHAPVLANQRLAGLHDERIAQESHHSGKTRQVGYADRAEHCPEACSHGMDGVVAIQLGLFEGQQVGLLLEDIDPPAKWLLAGFGVETDLGNLDPVEGLHQKGPLTVGRNRRQLR